MQSIPVLVSHSSPRLQYVLNWLLKEQLGLDYTIETDPESVSGHGFYIAYGNNKTTAPLYVPDEHLLREHQHTGTSGYIFPGEITVNETVQYSSDVFSAIFFLLSRYEEYLLHTKDKHGRYPAVESVLYQQNLLEIPIVDEWVQQLRTLLKEQFNIATAPRRFSFLPTYDIDIAWSYKNKGFARNAGALTSDVLKGKFTAVAERLQVLSGVKKDPYDAFDFLFQLHEKYHVRPLYFILAALKTTPFDKNILPGKNSMHTLIRRLQQDGVIGMHPSYYSNNEAVFSAEKTILEKITGNTIQQSRQHYIKLDLPATCHLLMQHSIYDDYSMGYGTHLGFRAGTGNSFLWYDLQQETVTPLRMHPFCFMDTTAHYDQQMNVSAAFEKLGAMAHRLEAANSRLVTVFHNFSTGTAGEWKGWNSAYEKFLSEYADAIS